MDGYELSNRNDSECKEIVKHHSGIKIREEWYDDYCDPSSKSFQTLYTEVEKLFRTAANTSGLGEEYQRFDNMEVYPTDTPDACDDISSPADQQEKAAVPLSLMPKKRARRKVRATDDELTVAGDMVMRRTESYDSTNTAKDMEEAVENVITNPDYTEDFNLTVVENSVSVGGVENQTCTNETCAEKRECYTEMDPSLGAAKAKCRCLAQYDDLSPNNITNPAEICADKCTRESCSYAGTCVRDQTYYDNLFCRCDDWRVGDDCSVDMTAVLLGGGITIGLLMILLLVVAMSFTRRRRIRVSLERDADTSAASVQIRGFRDLPEDPRVHMEQDAPPAVHRVQPRQLRTLPQQRDRFTDAPERSRTDRMPPSLDPSSEIWFVSRNIPRPRLSL